MKKLAISTGLSVLSALSIVGLATQPVAAMSFALTSEGASILSWSSQYNFSEGTFLPVNNSLVTARENLLSPTKNPWLNNGETGFIFARGDLDQKLVLDLGQTRLIDRIGVDLAPFPGDREVWDFLEVRVSLDNVTYRPWGNIGAPDGIVDITTPSHFIDQPDRLVRYIEYSFGPHSFDYAGGGSRIRTLYANQTTVSTVSVVEPSSTLSLLALGTLGVVSSSNARRKQQKDVDSNVR